LTEGVTSLPGSLCSDPEEMTSCLATLEVSGFFRSFLSAAVVRGVISQKGAYIRQSQWTSSAGLGLFPKIMPFSELETKSSSELRGLVRVGVWVFFLESFGDTS